MSGQDNKIEPIVLLLCMLVVFFTGVLVAVAKLMSSDGQTFQIIAGLVTGFSGALLMRVKPRGTNPEDPEGSTVTTRSTLSRVVEPAPPVDGAPKTF